MKQRFWVTAAVASSLALAGCAPAEPPPVHVPAAAAAWTSLDRQQLNRVLDATRQVLQQGDAGLNADLLSARISGVAQESIRAQYTFARLNGTTGYVTPIGNKVEAAFVTKTTSFPRNVFIVTEARSDGLPLLLSFAQPSARNNFTLTTYARLLPGVTLPQMRPFDEGGAAVPFDSATLAVTPTNTLAMYADVLTNYDTSTHLGAFEDDVFRAKLRAIRDQIASQLKEQDSYATSTAVIPDSLSVIGTVNGGAIVMGGLRTTTTVSVKDSTVTLGDLESKLLQGSVITKSLTREWLDTVAFYVPPSNVGGKIQVLAADENLVSVSGE